MIELALSPSGDLTSRFTSALTGRAIDLVAGRPDDVHPFTAVAGAWRKVSRSASGLLVELRAAEGRVRLQESAEAVRLEIALKALIYDATEVFDLYQQAIPKRLEQGRTKPEVRAVRDYQVGVKRLRDPIALICNKLKHDHREIGSCLILSQTTASSTWVFRITAVYGDLQTADRDVHRQVHPEGRFISYERFLHELIHGLIRADHNAGVLIRGLADNAADAIDLRGAAPLGLASVLADLGNRRPVCARSEPGRIPGVEVVGDIVRLRRLEAVIVPEPSRRIMPATTDEVGRNIQMFI